MRQSRPTTLPTQRHTIPRAFVPRGAVARPCAYLLTAGTYWRACSTVFPAADSPHPQTPMDPMDDPMDLQALDALVLLGQQFTRVIGFVGRAGAGKDTAADVIKSMYPAGVTTMAFAQPLKDICSQAFLLDPLAYADRRMKETVDPRWGMSPRQMAQRLGTDFFRELDPDFWVKRARFALEDKIGGTVIFTDVRFLNEAEFVSEELGGMLVYLDADRRLNLECSDRLHASEREVYEIRRLCDAVVENNGDLLEFRNKIEMAAWSY